MEDCIIPDDIIFSEIVVRVGVKSACQFKCVSKRWKSIISSAEFGKQIRRIEGPLTTLLYPFSTGLATVLDIQDEDGLSVSSVGFLPNDILPIVRDHKIVGWSKGLILSIKPSGYPKFVTSISNPLTKQILQLPKSISQLQHGPSHVFAMGLVARPDLMTYKVVLIHHPIYVDNNVDAFVEASVEIFSSDTGRWADFGSPELRFPCSIFNRCAQPCFVYKGVLHWLACNNTTIVTYDPYNNPHRLGFIPLPFSEGPSCSKSVMYSPDENLLRCVINKTNNILFVWRLEGDNNNHKWLFEGKLQFSRDFYLPSILLAPFPWNHDVFCVPYATSNNKLLVMVADWSSATCQSIKLLQQSKFFSCCKVFPLIPLQLCPWASPSYAQHPC